MSAVGPERKKKITIQSHGKKRTTLPAKIIKQLRSEVGYVCPFPECNDPYLTFHHFDPPWHEGLEHDPEGMIALCLRHHKRADVGAYPKDQLRGLKHNKNIESVSGSFQDWHRSDALFLGGSTILRNCFGLVRIDEQPLIWFETNNHTHHSSLSFDFYSASGELLCMMRNSIWTYFNNGGDLKCATSGNQIHISEKHHKNFFEVKFQPLKLIKRTIFLNDVSPNIPFLLDHDETLVISLRCNISWPQCLIVSERFIVANNVTMSSGSFSDGDFLIDI